ncbi:MAG TPA: hypothetical protein VFS83_14025, partial [Ktedonobacterales bacterium]|nr:hypothetical protein [Ktedonobacterales bacterium]
MRPEPSTANSAESASPRDARRPAIGYALARMLWVAVALLTVGIFAISLPAYAAQMQTLCPTSSCANGQINA